METLKKPLSLLLLVALVLSLAACGGSNRKPQEIIEEMVTQYGANGEAAAGQTETQLRELRSVDSDAADRWERIMTLWRGVDAGAAVNYDALPEGLTDTDALCIVCLGFQLNPDGSMREELVQRLTVLKACAAQYPNAYLVCTGGGTAADNDAVTEAGEMARWLYAEGIDRDRVIVEDKSRTTAENAMFTCQILAEQYPQVRQLAIVSSDYHIATGELLFGAEAILKAEKPGAERFAVVSNAAWKAPTGTLSRMFQAGALIELSGDADTAYDIYFGNYDIHPLPARS